MIGGRLPELVTERLCGRIVRPEDAPVWVDYLRRNDARFAPWEPERSEEYLSLRYWRASLSQHRRDAHAGVGYRFHLWSHESDALVGVIALREIQRGYAQKAVLGYTLDRSIEGRGYVQEAIGAILPFAFGELSLHRVEATVMPANERSKRTLGQAGFRCDGVLRESYRIRGRWEDHEIWSRLASDA
jgi:[ribosomal protein S5]-alanine N-acetyltransferase